MKFIVSPEVHSKYNSFANIFLNICNKHAPLETLENKIKMPKNPWMTFEIIKLINKSENPNTFPSTLN